MTSIHRVANVIIDNGDPVLGELRVEHEVEIIHSLGPKRDPNWAHMDEAGHYHAYNRSPEDEYPTLLERPELIPCDGSCPDGYCEGYTVVRYECRICRAGVKPGQIAGPHTESMPGRKGWSVAIQTPSAFAADRLVSVRIHTQPADKDGGLEFFGVAEARAESVTLRGARWMLHGVGALGQRPLDRAAVARTLDVAEATADKARAVGLARETET